MFRLAAIRDMVDLADAFISFFVFVRLAKWVVA